MSRLIDADALETYWECFDDPDIDYEYVLKADIDAAPTIDSVKHGRWKREVLGSTSGYGTTVMYQCSECERMAISKYNYCPNCGALMREDGGEG